MKFHRAARLCPKDNPGCSVKDSGWLCGGIWLFHNQPMGSLKKRRKAKINKHKRRKKLRLNRHKKRTWQK
jgi:hypothetical protein